MLSNERNALILLQLLLANGIKQLVVSPGTTNSAFVVSAQRLKLFKMISCVDERSAGYIATGLAAASGSPVVICCTGATASRNYGPALTEAFYRKLPILAVTGSQHPSRYGHLVAQVIDRTLVPLDVAKLSVNVPSLRAGEDSWEVRSKICKAIAAINDNGGGPAHINLETNYDPGYDVKTLPAVPNIRVLAERDFSEAPELLNKRINIIIGSTSRFNKSLNKKIDQFCEHFNVAVFCDHTSGYFGKYRLDYSLMASQENFFVDLPRADISIHIGEVTGDYSFQALVGKSVWRVSEDGNISDTFKKLRYVFKGSIESFLSEYLSRKHIPGQNSDRNVTYFKDKQILLDKARKLLASTLKDQPLSNIKVASVLSPMLQSSSNIHFAILNSLRAWNFFELMPEIRRFSNVGGFGIDGCMSSAVGCALASPSELTYLIIGDLAFFYDMNILGNRDLPSNLRIVLINNGQGVEFKNYGHHTSHLGQDADNYVSASGHFSRPTLKTVEHVTKGFGLSYRKVDQVDQLLDACNWLIEQTGDTARLIEVETKVENEHEALRLTKNLMPQLSATIKRLILKRLGRARAARLKSWFGNS